MDHLPPNKATEMFPRHHHALVTNYVTYVKGFGQSHAWENSVNLAARGDERNAPSNQLTSDIRSSDERGAQFDASVRRYSGDRNVGGCESVGGRIEVATAPLCSSRAHASPSPLSPFFHAVSGFRGRVL